MVHFDRFLQQPKNNQRLAYLFYAKNEVKIKLNHPKISTSNPLSELLCFGLGLLVGGLVHSKIS